MDRLTQSKERISFARVLVEVDASKEYKDEIEITLPSGKIVSQRVRYESKPKLCDGCKTLGHSLESCSGTSESLVNKRGVPKSNNRLPIRKGSEVGKHKDIGEAPERMGLDEGGGVKGKGKEVVEVDCGPSKAVTSPVNEGVVDEDFGHSKAVTLPENEGVEGEKGLALGMQRVPG